jgi:hypothetical protein
MTGKLNAIPPKVYAAGLGVVVAFKNKSGIPSSLLGIAALDLL